MHYAGIKYHDIANGLGVRSSLFVSGCRHGCKGCFNQEAWDFSYGKCFDAAAQSELLASIQPYYISGLTLLGGEPLDPAHQKEIAALLRDFRAQYGDSKNLWCYTGYVYEEDFLPGGRAYTADTAYILEQIDVLVDGPFVEELYDISLKFRGSANQRLLDLPKSRKTGMPCVLAI